MTTTEEMSGSPAARPRGRVLAAGLAAAGTVAAVLAAAPHASATAPHPSAQSAPQMRAAGVAAVVSNESRFEAEVAEQGASPEWASRPKDAVLPAHVWGGPTYSHTWRLKEFTDGFPNGGWVRYTLRDGRGQVGSVVVRVADAWAGLPGFVVCTVESGRDKASCTGTGNTAVIGSK